MTLYTPYYVGGWVDAPATTTPIVAASLNAIEAGIIATWGLAASTGQAGFALANSTSNILTWTAPNDGNLHRASIVTNMNVTVAETGGQIQVSFTTPDGTVQTFQQHAAGLSTGLARTNSGIMVKANTTVTLSQSTALTAGAATLWADIWAQ